jgi:hypothetical protein
LGNLFVLGQKLEGLYQLLRLEIVFNKSIVRLFSLFLES